MLLRQSQQALLNLEEALTQALHRTALPQAHTHGHLIIARAARMEFGTGRSAAGQLRLDIHVDILVLRSPDKSPLSDLPGDFIQVRLNGPVFLFTEDAQ
jgi:hypothetical protein